MWTNAAHLFAAITSPVTSPVTSKFTTLALPLGMILAQLNDAGWLSKTFNFFYFNCSLLEWFMCLVCDPLAENI